MLMAENSEPTRVMAATPATRKGRTKRRVRNAMRMRTAATWRQRRSNRVVVGVAPTAEERNICNATRAT